MDWSTLNEYWKGVSLAKQHECAWKGQLAYFAWHALSRVSSKIWPCQPLLQKYQSMHSSSEKAEGTRSLLASDHPREGLQLHSVPIFHSHILFKTSKYSSNFLRIQKQKEKWRSKNGFFGNSCAGISSVKYWYPVFGQWLSVFARFLLQWYSFGDFSAPNHWTSPAYLHQVVWNGDSLQKK